MSNRTAAKGTVRRGTPAGPEERIALRRRAYWDMHSKKVEQCLNFCCEMGRQLIRNGAEIYRVEESANRMLAAYGYEEAEVFAVPSCVIMSIHYGERNYTKSVRIKSATNNLDKLDRLNALCREVCRDVPEVEDAFTRLREIMGRPSYPAWLSYFGYGCVAAFFTLFWGGHALDAAIAFLCGMIVKAAVGYMVRLNANVFFVNLCASMLLVMVPVTLTYAGCAGIHTDKIIIGAIMLLVPGIAITNVMRDVIIGDFMTALSKLAEVLIVAMAIAVGIAIPFGLARALLGGV